MTAVKESTITTAPDERGTDRETRGREKRKRERERERERGREDKACANL